MIESSNNAGTTIMQPFDFFFYSEIVEASFVYFIILIIFSVKFWFAGKHLYNR